MRCGEDGCGSSYFDEVKGVDDADASTDCSPEDPTIWRHNQPFTLSPEEDDRAVRACATSCAPGTARMTFDLSGQSLERIGPLLRMDNDSLAAATARLIGVWNLETYRADLLALAKRAKTSDGLRQAALDGLTLRRDATARPAAQGADATTLRKPAEPTTLRKPVEPTSLRSRVSAPAGADEPAADIGPGTDAGDPPATGSGCAHQLQHPGIGRHIVNAKAAGDDQRVEPSDGLQPLGVQGDAG